MRLRQRDLKAYTLKKKVSSQQADGTVIEGYEGSGSIIRGHILPAGGKVAAEMYGERLAYMLTMYCPPSVNIKETDGICVNTDPLQEPDYRVVAIQNWGSHKVVSLEAIR